MELTEIERHARALMTYHGVGRLTFGFNNTRTELGHCAYEYHNGVRIPVRIELSAWLTKHMTPEEIRDTVLHEIAHALCPDKGHGPLWKAYARRIGANPERKGRVAAHPGHPIEGKCQMCNKVVSHNHRLPLRVYFHPKCGMDIALGLLVWYRNGKQVELGDMPARYIKEYYRLSNDARHNALQGV